MDEVEKLESQKGKRIKEFKFTSHHGAISLESIILEDGTTLTLYASDYDNIVAFVVVEDGKT